MQKWADMGLFWMEMTTIILREIFSVYSKLYISLRTLLSSHVSLYLYAWKFDRCCRRLLWENNKILQILRQTDGEVKYQEPPSISVLTFRQKGPCHWLNGCKEGEQTCLPYLNVEELVKCLLISVLLGQTWFRQFFKPVTFQNTVLTFFDERDWSWMLNGNGCGESVLL